jgi:hypothetical protein
MALSKIDPKKVFKTCSILDPAIDKEATGEKNMKEFEESYNMSLLKFKDGEFPTIFHIMNILSSDEAKIKQEHLKIDFPELDNSSEDEIKAMKPKNLKPVVRQINTQEMMVKYFKSAVQVYEENGQVFPCEVDVFPYTVVQEIGSIVMMRTQIGDDLKNVLGS